jgi:dihydrofolate synthase/folylpolyglutamate synthase
MTAQDNYEEALNWLYDLQYFGMKLGLANTRTLLSEMGNPHEKLRAVHVAGTNGKGSVCAFLTSILMDAGLKVGTYTSPHLSDFGERICINGYPMNRSEVLRSIDYIRPKIEALAEKEIQCTFFEATTCMAFRHFARRKVDAAVIEVGMGGRLDSTNVIEPALSIITNISREHTQHLGDTLGQIAGEKAGIIKKGIPTVSAVPEPEARSVIVSKAKEMQSRLHHVHELADVKIVEQDLLGTTLSITTKSHKYNNIHIKLPGAHQTINAATSVLAAEILSDSAFPLSRENIVRGMEATRWAARLQAVRQKPTVILDATHNPGGAETLAVFLKKQFPRQRPVMVIAMLADKEVDPVVKLLEPLVSQSIVTQSSYARRMKAADLASRFSGEVEVEECLGEAIDRAIQLAGPSGTVLITGSIFTASEALAHLDSLKLNELIAILAEAHGIGAYPGRNPETDGPPAPGSQEPFKVLISTILSQRTKDENTHIASESLFSKFDTPEKLANASPAEVEPLIRSAGFYKQKTISIIQTSKIIRDEYDSKVPDSMTALTALPGVGRKTANCVLAYGFGIPAIAVDTHVHRISNLLGLVKTENPDDTEFELSRKVPIAHWHDINRLLVRHGQTICKPVKPMCEKCSISHLCDYGIYKK